MGRPLSADENLSRVFAGRWCVVAAAILWSTSGFFAKLPLWETWPVESQGILIAFWRALFASITILPFVRKRSWRWPMLPMSISFGAMSALYLSAFALTTGANAIWLQNTAPWWVFLVGAIWLGEPVRRRDVITLGFCVAGVSTILYFELKSGGHWGALCALGSAVGYASVVLFLRQLRAEDSAWLVVVNQLGTTLLLLPLVLTIGLWPTTEQLMVLAAFGFFQMALPYLLFGWGLKHISGNEAVAIGLIEPILLPLWAYLTRAEVPKSWTIAGAAIILAGLILRYGLVRKRAA